MDQYYPTINIGDILTRRKLLGLIEHRGVVIGYDMVLHNTPERGEHAATLADFADGQAIKVKPTGADPSMVSTRSREILSRPQPYNPLKRNCQHTASEATDGVARSPGATLAILAMAIGVIFGVVISIRKR